MFIAAASVRALIIKYAALSKASDYSRVRFSGDENFDIRSSLLGRHRLNLESFPDDVAGVGDNRLTFDQAAVHLEAVAVVTADLDLLQVDGAAVDYHGHLRAFSADDQGVAGNPHRRI